MPPPSTAAAALRSGSDETLFEYDQDVFFGLCFLGIALFAAVRVARYFDPRGSGRVITLFYFLIFLCSASRSVWFLIPNYNLEVSYTPQPQVAWQTPGWAGTFVSELLEATGSLALYAVFVLVSCYWGHMTAKATAEPLPNNSARPKGRPYGAINTFFAIFSVVVAAQALNIALFLGQVENSEGMILFDSIMLSLLAVFAGVHMTVLRSRIRVLLTTIGAINASSSSTRPHTERILAMTRVGNAFFVAKIAVECSLAISCFLLMRARRSFSVVLNDSYWEAYLLIKHTSEVAALLCQLVISTAIKHYDVPRALLGAQTGVGLGDVSQVRGRIRLHTTLCSDGITDMRRACLPCPTRRAVHARCPS